jgi:hypothetical protein
MKDGIGNESYWCKPTTLQDYIKQEVHRAVRERIMTKYEIEIKERE